MRRSTAPGHRYGYRLAFTGEPGARTAGVYLVRLVQAGRALSARAVVVR